MNRLFQGIYNGRKVLLTGHTGFKGSWLALWLNEMGANVFGYSLEAPSSPSHIDLLDLQIPEIIADVCDYDLLLKTIHDFQPEVVFHLAAQPLVRASYNAPRETFNTNLMGTVNILEAIRNTPSVKAGVFITTDKCYKSHPTSAGYNENDRLGGETPYAASKSCAELAIHSYVKSYFSGKCPLIASCRAGNVIGGGDWADDRLIPDLVRSVSSKSPAVIRYPQAVRPWQHVLEPLAGYLLIGQYLLEGKQEFADAWNFGPSTSGNISVGEVIALAKNDWQLLNVKSGDNGGFAEDITLTLDSTKAEMNLGWSPVWDTIETTVSKTIQWYKAYLEGHTIISLEQLNEFVADACSQNITWVSTE